MRRRLSELGIMNEHGELLNDAPGPEALYAMYQRAGGDTRSFDALCEEGTRKIRALQRSRGVDLGYGCGQDFTSPPEAAARMESIYRQARRALYATLDEALIKDVSPHHLRCQTRALNREEYL